MKPIKYFCNCVIQGDCLTVMKEIPENSVDTLITDPPAGISFMGLDFDSDRGGRDKWIEWLTEIMRECYRVLKPGAHGFVWALPRTSHWTATALENAGFKIKDIIMHIFGSGFPKSLNIGKKSGDPDWGGYGTALKPAAEHWVIIMKPNDKTYVDNALKWGVSGLNIAECRIPCISEEDKRDYSFNMEGNQRTSKQEGEKVGCHDGGWVVDKSQKELPKGRFPANIILDEEAGKILDEQQKGVSRFYYVAKASKSEKNAGCGDLPKKQKIFNGQSDKSSTDIKDVEKRFTTQPVSNNHPTVKPLKLMEYLCKLTKTPTGGIVLDPFAGSCTTACACINTGRDYIMIEQDKDYCEIGRARVKYYEKKNSQTNIFKKD